MLHAVHCGGRDGRFLVGLRDAQVEGGESFIHPGYVDAGLETGMVDCKALYYFHICFYWLQVFHEIVRYLLIQVDAGLSRHVVVGGGVGEIVQLHAGVYAGLHETE